jgi:hypothetical protein
LGQTALHLELTGALELTEIVGQPAEYFRYDKYPPQLLGLIIVRNGLEYGYDWTWADWLETVYQFASDY